MNLYLELEDYLAQWFINDHGGNNPVRLIRGSMEWGMLEQFLQTPPADYVPVVGGEGFVHRASKFPLQRHAQQFLPPAGKFLTLRFVAAKLFAVKTLPYYPARRHFEGSVKREQ